MPEILRILIKYTNERAMFPLLPETYETEFMTYSGLLVYTSGSLTAIRDLWSNVL
jgi:hypothetical protein